MKTLSPDGQILPDKVTKDGLLQNDAHWAEHGFGYWIFRAKDGGHFLGRAGLKWYTIDEREVVGLAYAVIFDHWNHGFATEMAAASLQIGFERLASVRSRKLDLAFQYRLPAGDGKTRLPLPDRYRLRWSTPSALPTYSERLGNGLPPTNCLIIGQPDHSTSFVLVTSLSPIFPALISDHQAGKPSRICFQEIRFKVSGSR